jgi:hypothetical protein
MGGCQKSCQELVAIDLGFLIGFCFVLFKQASKLQKNPKASKGQFPIFNATATYLHSSFQPFHSIEGFIN